MPAATSRRACPLGAAPTGAAVEPLPFDVYGANLNPSEIKSKPNQVQPKSNQIKSDPAEIEANQIKIKSNGNPAEIKSNKILQKKPHKIPINSWDIPNKILIES